MERCARATLLLLRRGGSVLENRKRRNDFLLIFQRGSQDYWHWHSTSRRRRRRHNKVVLKNTTAPHRLGQIRVVFIRGKTMNGETGMARACSSHFGAPADAGIWIGECSAVG